MPYATLTTRVCSKLVTKMGETVYGQLTANAFSGLSYFSSVLSVNS